MKKIFILFFFLVFQQVAHAQINELGLYLGGSNYIGDIGKTQYIDPNEPAIGILYKWNKSPRHAFRFSYIHSTITGDDLDSEVPGRFQRGYNFKNTLDEFSAGIEFNFFDFNLHKELTFQFTPYIHTGVSYLIYDGLFFEGGEAKSNSTNSTIAIPMTLGVKSNIIKNLILGLEVGARYTFADDLDGSNPTNKNLKDLRFGNLNSNDWYVFSGITLTYTFGESPCYCKN